MLEGAHSARLVYLLEDDDVQLHFVAEYLKSLHYSVRCFSEPDELLRAVREKAPDILITDYILPEGISGEESAREARRIAPNVQIVFLSSHPRPTETIADHWIAKGNTAFSALGRVLDLL